MSARWQILKAEDVAKDGANALLLDVRTPAEFAEVHIPGSVLNPLDRLDPVSVRQLAEGKSACVLVCRSGGRAAQAAKALQAAGILKLAVLDGGIIAWQSAGLEVTRGRKTISLERQVRIGAGSLVLLGVVLGFAAHPAFFLLSGFVGTGLVFAGITDWCGMGLLLARMPWNQR